jgi:two-component system sensor histidine kinase PilS (NtrC family)
MPGVAHELRGAAFPVAASGEPPWQPLGYFSLYRILLAGLLFVLVTWGGAPRPLGAYDLTLFHYVSGTYLALGFLDAAFVRARWPAFGVQVVLQVFTDIVALTLLMHASGGVASGFGLLMVVAIAGGSILMHGRIAVLFAALASLSVLTQQIYVWLNSPFPATNYPHAGILGAAFFATAWLAWVSAQRLRESEALAARREVDLANLSQLSQHIVERMQAGILAIDPGGVVRLANKSAQRLLGLSQRPSGRSIEESSHALAERLSDWHSESGHSSYLIQPARGQLQLQVSFAALGTAAREGVLVFLEDTAVMNQRAQELKLASLGRLSASIAHEIRNPLSAISHAGQLLGESSHLDAEDQRLTRIIRDNSERMNVVIENVLQLGRGRRAEPTELALGPWLESLVDELDSLGLIARAQVTLTVEPPDLHVRADPSQLRQVVWNLCENAAQHSGDEPRLQLEARISPDNRRPVLDVRDQGDGIEAALVDVVFEPFFTSRAGGTGLGLYIARELCAGNQAALTHVPTEVGCCFRITFSDPRRRRPVPE